jgi:hypothetical protein
MQVISATAEVDGKADVRAQRERILVVDTRR